MNSVSTSHGPLVSVVVGGREARTRPSLGKPSRLLDISGDMSELSSDTPVGANPSDGAFAGAVVLPYTPSSQSSIITSLVIPGRRARSRMVYMFSRAGSGDGQSDLVSSRLEVSLPIMYIYVKFHRVIR